MRQALGSRLAAAALGLKDTRTLSSWARGGPVRSAEGEHRLQVLFRVVTALTDAFSPAVAAAFLRGSNPTLGDQAPMIVLAEEPPTAAESQLLSAVEALLNAWTAPSPPPRGRALLRCSIAGPAGKGPRARVRQMAGLSSSNAVANRNSGVASTASS